MLLALFLQLSVCIFHVHDKFNIFHYPAVVILCQQGYIFYEFLIAAAPMVATLKAVLSSDSLDKVILVVSVMKLPGLGGFESW